MQAVWEDGWLTMPHIDAVENIRFWNHGLILFCVFGGSWKDYLKILPNKIEIDINTLLYIK